MKKIFVSICFVFIASASAWSQDWKLDFEEAKAIASKENRHIILVFQGSDWCAPCIKLDKEIWSTAEFQDYAKEHFVMLKADFPRKKANRLEASQEEKNAQLAEKYNQEGYFPLVVVLDDTGKVLGKTGYKKTTPKEYYELLSSF